MPRSGDRHTCFAITAPGLAPVVAGELEALGVAGTVDPAGVEFEGTLGVLYDASLRLRAASRILVRVAEFSARTFYELERRAAKVPWRGFLAPGRAAALRVTSRKSRLYHEGAIAQRLAAALPDGGVARGGGVASGGGTPSGTPAGTPRGTPDGTPDGALSDPAGATAGERDEGEAAQLFVVRVFRDRFTISADASGMLLHRRGYRQELGKAPLRETLAAALLLASGWDARAPLLDPFCGSGTIPIEAALLARRIAPGLASADREPRRYAFQDWPGFDARVWDAVVARAREEILPGAPAPIAGTDRDRGAIRAARANAARAGVSADVAFDARPLSALEPPVGPGWLVTNPPYGVRVGERRALRDLYASLGALAREQLPGWTLALLSADRRLEAAARLAFEEELRTVNGGIPVRLARARVPVQ